MKPSRVFVSRICGVVLATASVLFLTSGCRVGYPFRGPGYDARQGVVHPDAGKQVLLVVTRGDIAAGAGDEFANQLRAVLDSMNEQDGLIGYSFRKELLGSRVWTMSVWIDRASIERFVRSTAHREAMNSGSIAPGSFITAYSSVDASLIPLSWAQAERMLADRAREE